MAGDDDPSEQGEGSDIFMLIPAVMAQGGHGPVSRSEEREDRAAPEASRATPKASPEGRGSLFQRCVEVWV